MNGKTLLASNLHTGNHLSGPFPEQITLQQCHDLLENIQIMAMILDASVRVLYSNPYLQTTLGITSSQSANSDWFATGALENQENLTTSSPQKFRDLIDSQVSSWPYTQAYVSQEGEQRLIVWKNTAIQNTQGKTEFVLCFGEDITEQTKNETERLQLLETLENHVVDRTVELEALYTVATIANEMIDLPHMLEKMLIQVLQATGVPYGAIHLLDADEEELHLVAQVGISPEVVKRISSITTGFGLTGWVAQQRQPLVLMNVSDDPRILTIGQVSGYSLYLSAPLLSHNQLLGVISIFGDSTQQLNAEKVALLTTIADHIGIAVESFQLRTEANRNAILEERQRMARELHDSVTQALYSLTLLAAAGQRSAQDNSQERTLRNLNSISDIAFQTLKEMRLLVYELQLSTLGPTGLVEAIQHRLDAVEIHSGMQTQLITTENLWIPQPVEIELFGLVQEALNNSIKHANATSVTVSLAEKAGNILLEIRDNGHGFNLKEAEKKHGTGLINMKKRAHNLGGQIKITTAPGEGTCVRTTIPVSNGNRPQKNNALEEIHD